MHHNILAISSRKIRVGFTEKTCIKSYSLRNYDKFNTG